MRYIFREETPSEWRALRFTNEVQHRYGPELRWASIIDRRIMGRHPSTIGRELRRNSLPKGSYRPASADRIALPRLSQLNSERVKTVQCRSECIASETQGEEWQVNARHRMP